MADLLTIWENDPVLVQYLDNLSEREYETLAHTSIDIEAADSKERNELLEDVVCDALRHNNLDAAERFMVGASQHSKEWAIMHGDIAASCVRLSQIERGRKHLKDLSCIGLTAELTNLIFVKYTLSIVINVEKLADQDKHIKQILPCTISSHEDIQLALASGDIEKRKSLLSALHRKLEKEIENSFDL